ncbi:hypothetical protein HK096_006734 [Nowakowskiella sp. JEL0078]|nr:hypothetical protein HK096_006734 [Nowakowskiella sp. JEL0078]
MFAWLIHITTHICNEYYDFETDCLNSKRGQWSGGSGILVNGLLSLSLVRNLAFGLFFVTTSFTLVSNFYDPLSPFHGYSLLISIAILNLSWFYTAPPFKFQYNGMGELVVASTMSILLPTLSAIMQHQGKWIINDNLLPIISLLFVQNFVRMLVMNVHDIESDAKCGKNTLTSLLGVRITSIVYKTGQIFLTAMPLIYFALNLLQFEIAFAFMLATPMGWKNSLKLDKEFENGKRKEVKCTKDLPFQATMHVVFTVLVVTVVVLSRSLFNLPLASTLHSEFWLPNSTAQI